MKYVSLICWLRLFDFLSHEIFLFAIYIDDFAIRLLTLTFSSNCPPSVPPVDQKREREREKDRDFRHVPLMQFFAALYHTQYTHTHIRYRETSCAASLEVRSRAFAAASASFFNHAGCLIFERERLEGSSTAACRLVGSWPKERAGCGEKSR